MKLTVDVFKSIEEQCEDNNFMNHAYELYLWAIENPEDSVDDGWEIVEQLLAEWKGFA